MVKIKNHQIESVKMIAIIDMDPYSRNWISQLLMRDWRTQVIFETPTISEFILETHANNLPKIDGIIINLDHYQMDLNQFNKLLAVCKSSEKIILISTIFQKDAISYLVSEKLGGYLIKSDVEISIVWAIIKAIQGHFVISETVERNLIQSGVSAFRESLVFDGIEASEFLTESENRNARLAFVFSMSRGNMADELTITPKSSWTLISTLYSVLGIKDLLLGDDWINFNLEQDRIINDHIVSIGDKRSDKSNAATKETLAFHVYTKPKMHAIKSIR